MIINVDHNVNEIENLVDSTIKPEKRLVRQLSVNLRNLSESYNKMKSNKVLPSLDKNFMKQNKQRNNVNPMLLVKNENVTPLIQCINYNVFSIRTPWKYISKENTLRNNIHELLAFFKILQKLLNKYFLQYNLSTQLTERGPDDDSLQIDPKLEKHLQNGGLYKSSEVFDKETVLGKKLICVETKIYKEDNGYESDDDIDVDDNLNYLISFCNNIYNKINILFEPIVDNKENKAAILKLKESEDDRNVIYINNKYYSIKHFGADLPSLNYQKYVILDLCSYNHIGVYDNFEYMNEFMGQIISLPMNDKYIPTLTYILKVVSVALFWINFDSKDNLIILNYNNINFNIMLIYACIMIATGTETSELESKLLNTLTWRRKVNTGGVPNNENIPMMYPLLKWPTCYKRYLSYYKQLNSQVKNNLTQNKELEKRTKEYDKQIKESEKCKTSEAKDNICTPTNGLDMNYIIQNTSSLYSKKLCQLNNIVMINTLIPQYNIDIEIYQINDYNNTMYNYFPDIATSADKATEYANEKKANDGERWLNNSKVDPNNTSCKHYNSIFFKNYKCCGTQGEDTGVNESDTKVHSNIKLLSCPYNYSVTTTNASSPGASGLLNSLNIQQTKGPNSKSLNESDVIIYNYNNSGVVLEDDIILVFVVNKNKLNRKSIGSYSFNTNMLTNTTMQLTKYDLDIWEQNNNILLLNNVKIIINTTELQTSNLQIPKSLNTSSKNTSKQLKSNLGSGVLESNLSPKLTSSAISLDETSEVDLKDEVGKVLEYEIDSNSIVFGSVLNFINNHIKKIDMKECDNLIKLTGHNKETCILALKICNNFSNAMNLLIKLSKPYHNNYYNNNIANDYYNNVNVQEDHPFINHMSKLQIGSTPKIKSTRSPEHLDKVASGEAVADISLFENINNENLLKLLNYNGNVITHNITSLQLHQFITSDSNYTYSTSVSDVLVAGNQLNNAYPTQTTNKVSLVSSIGTGSEDKSGISVDPTGKLAGTTPIRIDSTFNNLELIKSIPVKSTQAGQISGVESTQAGQIIADPEKEVILTTRLNSNISSPVNVPTTKSPASSSSSSSDVEVKDITLTTTINVPDKINDSETQSDKDKDKDKLEEKDKDKLLEKDKVVGKKVPPPPIAKSAGKAPPPVPKKGGKLPPPIPKGPVKSVKRVLPLGVKLHWKPLNKFNDTIFSSIHESDIYNQELIDTTTIKKLFSRTSTSTTSLTNMGSADLNDKNKLTNGSSTSKKTKLIEILDNKRVQNLSIILRFNSYEDYLTLLKNVNSLVYINLNNTTKNTTTKETDNSVNIGKSDSGTEKILDAVDIFGNLNDTVVVDNITKLYIVYPTSNEIELLMNSYKQNSNLEEYRPVERMLLEILLRENMLCKIKLCKYLIDLKHQLNLINDQLEVYKLAMEEIKTSRILPLILNIILQYGNFVNYGSIKAEKGFTLSSTIKLIDFKTQDNLLSSLHYLIINLYIKLYKNTTEGLDDTAETKVNSGTSSTTGTKDDGDPGMEFDEVEISNDLLYINTKLTNVLRAEKISSADINTILKDLSNELVNIISLLNATNNNNTHVSNASTNGTNTTNGTDSTNMTNNTKNEIATENEMNEKMNNVVHICKNKLNEVNLQKTEIYKQIKDVWTYLGEDVSSITKTVSGGVGEELSNLENIFKILSELIKCIIKVFNDVKSKPTKYLIVLSNEEDKQLFLKLFMDNKSLSNYNKMKTKRVKHNPTTVQQPL
ncbi:uncharacterized protein TA03495 [Theileria annulata]|uniref:FH2 domain-containing protein n=1 Tax=Theileria annulata TaxID=5874 RepID=Q4UCJ8_THEAN|nr:uncharacterized protein TA03495 [Theileria annulata]CAI75453.1 hypothetical protein, conserved [Theileria annulata]|eukprot:XP_954929.1 hypothetical protein, conserved [Theileria annulata]